MKQRPWISATDVVETGAWNLGYLQYSRSLYVFQGPMLQVWGLFV